MRAHAVFVSFILLNIISFSSTHLAVNDRISFFHDQIIFHRAFMPHFLFAHVPKDTSVDSLSWLLNRTEINTRV